MNGLAWADAAWKRGASRTVLFQVGVMRSGQEPHRRASGFLLRAGPKHPGRRTEFGPYRFVADRLKVCFGDSSVELSMNKFRLAKLLFDKAGTPLLREQLYAGAWGGRRTDVVRLIDANLALLQHVLKLDGRHGYLLRRDDDGRYCLVHETASLPPMREAQG